MFKIGEFSKLTNVSVRMLRYYDETGLLKPSKINDKTGYRMYSVEQTKILNKIIFLRDIGFNVEEIMYALKHWDKDNLKNQIEEKANSCKSAIKAEEEKLEKIRIAINEINSEYEEINYNVIVKTIPSYNVISLRKTISNYFCEGELWNELFKFIEDEKLKISISNLNFAIYHDKEYKEENVDVEVCIVTEDNGIAKSNIKYRKTKEFNKVASSMVYGPFENIAGAYKAFVKWLEENGQYRINGISMQICHKGPWNESDPNNYLTEIQIPLEDKNNK